MSLLHDLSLEETEMEMTPLIDVTFLLLVFFLCTIKFKTLEGKLNAYLPKDAGVTTHRFESVEEVEVFIRLLSPGAKVFPEGHELADRTFRQVADEIDARFEFQGRALQYELGPRTTADLETLTAWVLEARRQDAGARALISSDEGAVYGDVVPVLDCLVASGFERISIAGAQRARRN